MTEYQNRSRFIPYRKADVVEICATDSRLSELDQNSFREFCRILESLIHFEFHYQVETLKDSYAPFNPDADTRLKYTYSDQEKRELQKKLVKTLTHVLNAANFEKITEADLKEALDEESLFKIRLKVDFQDFEDVVFYHRGISTKRETFLSFFGLRKKRIEFTNYESSCISNLKRRITLKLKSKKASISLQAQPLSNSFKMCLRRIWRCFFPIAKSA